ncbi:MAG: O-antigen ligase family protein [Candidatus Omnitrophota bacterium]
MIDLVASAIFFGGIAAVLIFSLTGRVYLSLMFLVPLFPLQNIIERLHQFPSGKDFVDILLVIIVLGWGFGSMLRNRSIFEKTPFNKLILVMILFTYLSLWRGSSYLGFAPPLNLGDPRFHAWKNYMIFPLLYFVTVNNIRSLKHIKWLVLAMAFSVLIMNRYTGGQLKWFPNLLVSREKIHGTFVWTGVNVVAAFYAQYIFVFFGLFLTYKKKLLRILFGVLAAFGLYICLFLFSRGAYFGLLAGFLVISILRKRSLIVPLVLLLVFWQSLLPPSVVERISQTKTEEGELETSAQRRIDLWKESVELFQDNTIAGVGFNTVPYLGLAGGFADTHNIYLKILVEQGMIGFIIFISLLLLAIRSGWRLYISSSDSFLKGLGLGFIACVVSMMFTNFFGDRWTYLQIGTFFWVLLALVVRGNIINREELLSKNNAKQKR